MSDSSRPQGVYNSWNSPGHSTGVCSCSFLQGIFPTRGSNPGLPVCRSILYPLNHQEAPPDNAGDAGLIPGLGRSPGGGRVGQLLPVFLPGESPWTEKPGRLQSIMLQRFRHNSATKQSTHTYYGLTSFLFI